MLDIRATLAASPLFEGLTDEALDALAAKSVVHDIQGGAVLFREGDPAETFFVVASGRMRAVIAGGQVAGDIARGEPIGEIGLLAGENRSATVYAVRDSQLLQIRREDLTELIQRFPQALLAVTRVIVRRLRENLRTRTRESARSSRAFALLPATPDIDAVAVARTLVVAFAGHGRCAVLDAYSVDNASGPQIAQARVDDPEAHARLMQYLNTQEAGNDYLLYAASREPDPWTRRCMRQVDRVLVLVRSDAPAQATAMLEALQRAEVRAPVEVVLLRPEGAQSGNVLGWRTLCQARSHFFLRPESPRDIAALVRQLTGRGVGLVLGGGGARGFAHLGLMRALNELDIPVDVVGGTSMGAFFAGLVACGYSHHEMTHIARETFVSNNYLNDYLFPTVALIRGRRFVRRLKDIFGERRIEELRTPYFCVSTNLTRGTPVVHDRGSLHLWLATSMAVPGVAPPVAYRGDLLVDGAVVNSLPTDVMASLERGPIIASDVSTEGGISAPGIEGPDPEGLFKWIGPDKRPGLLSIIFRTATLTSESGVAQRAARADLYIRMPVGGIALFDWKRLDEVAQRGYEVALEKLGAARTSLLA
jgi:NTE family protein